MPVPGLDRATASRLAPLALGGIEREYPHKLDHVLEGPFDLQTPRALHPAFYGCFDWHSAVHSHWTLARLLRRFPDLTEARKIRAALDRNLTASNILREAEYFDRPGRSAFERPYGWAWLLKLAEELDGWEDPDAGRWSDALGPLAGQIVRNYREFLPRLEFPNRVGTHANTAFGMAFAWDYAVGTGLSEFQEFIGNRAREYFLGGQDYPARWEPGGEDFFSPALIEADLMARVLPPAEFVAWLDRFLPGLGMDGNGPFEPVTVRDRSDGRLVHLDGLNLSRAWCMRRVADALPAGHSVKIHLELTARRHAEAGLEHVASGDYAGEHWLPTFAVYLDMAR